ncbi:hypothetical protein EVAR_94249_1 [Eumeta japonica]|uniref:Uncharacterized protein n=1 Tax=Eumeta variegata TaxID=151549 RepID=A0A4C1UN53_EUMVA|nr:hypothetical protein EVAR_94249_1 [Eumeta japonica]
MLNFILSAVKRPPFATYAGIRVSRRGRRASELPVTRNRTTDGGRKSSHFRVYRSKSKCDRPLTPARDLLAYGLRERPAAPRRRKESGRRRTHVEALVALPNRGRPLVIDRHAFKYVGGEESCRTFRAFCEDVISRKEAEQQRQRENSPSPHNRRRRIGRRKVAYAQLSLLITDSRAIDLKKSAAFLKSQGGVARVPLYCFFSCPDGQGKELLLVE